MKSINDKINEELKKIKELPPFPEIINDQAIPSTGDTVFAWDDLTGKYTIGDDWITEPLDLANLTPLLNTVTLGASGAYTTYGGGSSGLYQGGLYTTTNPSYNWSTLNPSNKVNIHGSGIDLNDDADIIIGGRSMKKILDGIEQRLAILVPDPKKLERYEALKQAYEHYKTLEALCSDPESDGK